MIQKSELKGKRILIVDDDRETLDTLTEYVTREGHSVTSASDAESALHRIRAWKPHLILLDINMPGVSGLDLIPRIRSITQEDYASIILVSAGLEIEGVIQGLDHGGDDYLSKPFRSTELITRLRTMLRMKELQDNLRRYQHRIEELSNTDDLTGLLNMRALYRRAEEEIQRCRRFRKPISALLINLDQFSAVNENADFIFGNTVLREVAVILKKCVRTMDLVARVGADEFFVLLPETDLAGAEFVAERVREAIHAAEFKADKFVAKVTTCIGVAGFTNEHVGMGMGELFANCNESLRSAKVSGTNRVEIYSFV